MLAAVPVSRVPPSVALGRPARPWRSDGPRLLALVGAGLLGCGAVALGLAATQTLLPHDVAYLGVVAAQVCGTAQGGRILHFMFHDRTAFGGAVIAIGLLYVWLAEGPLRQGHAWAWWLFALNGAVGFGSFLAFLGFGYYDTWHGAATALLLPVFVGGLVRSWAGVCGPRHVRALWRPAAAGAAAWRGRAGAGRTCLLAAAAGMLVAGLTITLVGSTQVFVPQDLQYMNLTMKELLVISPRLVPLIAHDRAGFGGALAAVGVAMFFAVWCAAPQPGLWRVLAAAGAAGFATAIGVHPLIGYTDAGHLAPAFAGLALFGAGLGLSYRAMHPAAAGAGRSGATVG